jgi:hypothetical protein
MVMGIELNDLLNILTYLWLGLILSIFLLGLLLLESPLWIRISQLNRLTKFASGLQKQASSEETLSEARNTLLSKLSSISWLRHTARKFDQEWRAAVLKDRHAAIGPILLHEFLVPSVVLPGRANRHMALAIPGILVGLGIIGTFLGLVLGLPDIGRAGPSVDAGQLQELVGVITRSLGLAFWTSIAGIGLSLWFLFTDRLSVHLLERRVMEISRCTQAIYPCLPAAEITRMEYQLLKEVGDNLQTMGTDIGIALADAIEPAFGKAVGEHLAPVVQDIRSAVEKLADMSSEKQAEGVQQMVETFMQSMNQAVGDQFGQLREILTSTVESQESIRSGFKEFGSQLKDSASVQEKLIVETTRAAETLSGSLDRLESISYLLGQAAEKVMLAGATLEKSATAAVQAQENALEAQRELVQAAEAHSSAMENARQQLSEAWETAVEQARGAIYQIQEATKELKEGIGDQLLKALETFDKVLAETTERFSGTLAQVDDSVGELPKVAKAVQESCLVLEASTQKLVQGVEKTQEMVAGLISENIEKATDAASVLRETVESASGTIEKQSQFQGQLISALKNLDSLALDLESLRTPIGTVGPQLEEISVSLQPLMTTLTKLQSSMDGEGRLKLLEDALQNTTRELSGLSQVLSKSQEISNRGWKNPFRR